MSYIDNRRAAIALVASRIREIDNAFEAAVVASREAMSAFLVDGDGFGTSTFGEAIGRYSPETFAILSELNFCAEDGNLGQFEPAEVGGEADLIEELFEKWMEVETHRAVPLVAA